jgi:hypothetical protein
MFCLRVKWPLPPGNNLIAVNKYIIIIIIILCSVEHEYIRVRGNFLKMM